MPGGNLLGKWGRFDPGDLMLYDLVEHTTNDNIALDDPSLVSVIHSNTGASGPITLTLSAASAGDGVLILRDPDFDYDITVQLAGGDTANGGTAGGTVTVLSPGIISLDCVVTNNKLIVSSYGPLWSGT